MADTNTTDDYSNYVQPVTTNGPTTFTGTATAADIAVAEELARVQARENALTTFGTGTTDFTSFDEVKVKFNDNGTYTANYQTQALQKSEATPTNTPQEQQTINAGTENVFDPGTTFGTGDESVFNPQQTIEENVFDPGTTFGTGDESVFNPGAAGPATDLDTVVITAPRPTPSPFTPAKDWRFRISLAPKADYLYKVAPGEAGILNPLQSTNGVIFPYSPAISVAYTATYDTSDPTHSNYKIHTYKSSSVESISVGGDFTAQDSTEANYLLAVIHFFRTVTKMFYGQDQNPSRGVPPPLCYLSGFGQYQFDNHPVVITNFTYTLPTDVDYINAYPGGEGSGGVNLTPYAPPVNTFSTPLQRLLKSGLKAGGKAPAPVFTNASNIDDVTRVPTKISIALQCLPIVTRTAISNEFSLEAYATGSLLRGSKNSKTGGGIW